jgi:hypothetical protein
VLKIARSSRYAPAALVGRSLATRPNQERTWAGRTFPIDGGPAPQLARQRVPKDVMGVAVAVAAQRLADDGFVGPVTVETGQSSPVGTMGLRVRRRGVGRGEGHGPLAARGVGGQIWPFRRMGWA